MNKIIYLFFALYCLMSQVNAQVVFEVSAKKVADIDEIVNLTFSVNKIHSEFTPPDLSEFRIISGPSSATSTSFTVKNGKTTNSVSYGYSYNITSKKQGHFTIGKASVKIDSITYYTNPITIEFCYLIKPKHDSTFINLVLDKRNVFQGEQIKLLVNLYTSGQLLELQGYSIPMHKGFWTERIENKMPKIVIQENIDSVVFQKVDIHELIIFPLHTGEIIIDPFEIECSICKQADSSVNYKNHTNRCEVKKLKSKPLTIEVMPLPKDWPASFTGAVGKNFSIDASINRNNAKCQDTLILKLQITGNGNLKVLDRPKLNFPLSLNVFGPKVKFDLNKDIFDLCDTVIYEYIIIPCKKEKIIIPSIQFSYFDLESKLYKTLTTKPINLNIDQCDVTLTNIGQNKLIETNLVSGSDIILVCDVSTSMLALDFKPNRLNAYKNAVAEFIKQNKKNRIGLVTFAGKAYTLIAPTKDQSLLIDLVNKIDTGANEDGTSIGIGIATAINQLKNSKSVNKSIILLTDGSNNYGELDPITSAQIAKMNGIRLYTIGLGKNDSVMYPIQTLFGIQNEIMISKIDKATLMEISTIANGKYFEAASNADLTEIFKNITYLINRNTAYNKRENTDISRISNEMATRVLNAIETNENIILEKLAKEKKQNYYENQKEN